MQDMVEINSVSGRRAVLTPLEKAGRRSRLRLPKLFRTLARQGPGVFLRDSLYSYYYHAEERRKVRRGHAFTNLSGTAQLWGYEIELHPSFAGINEELLDFGVHEPLSTSIYQQLLRPGDHVIDVGANIGYFLLAAAQVVGEQGEFLAFEPVLGNYEVLQRNISRIPGLRNRVQLWPWAIGDSTGTCDFYESSVPNLGSLFRHEKLAQTRTITVQVRRLDDLIGATERFRPSFMRMDVEGAELLVLAGAKNLLRKYRPSLFIEFHLFSIGHTGLDTALDELESIGYREGVLIARLWDAPWISSWARRLQCWEDNLKILRKRIAKNPSHFPVLTLILKQPNACGRPALC